MLAGTFQSIDGLPGHWRDGPPPARGLYHKFHLAVNWFDLLYSFLRQDLSSRTIAHTFGLCSSWQLL